MTCRDLERWLDDGGAPERYWEAMAHARICAHCSSALGTMDELETLLAAPPAPAPEGFALRLMARVAETPQPRALIPVMELMPFFQTVPWWVRVTLEPASLLALLLASLLLWRGDAIYTLASSGAVQLLAWLALVLPTAVPVPAPPVAPGPIAAHWLQPVVLTAIALGAAPLALLGSRELYRWAALLAGPRHARPAVR